MAFFALANMVDLIDGYQQPFKINGEDLLLCQIEGQPFLIENKCPHMDVPLDRAVLDAGPIIRCLAHGIEFDLASGEAKGPLAGMLCGLKKYELAYEGTKVGVEL